MEERSSDKRHEKEDRKDRDDLTITIRIEDSDFLNCSIAKALSALGSFTQDLEREYEKTGRCHPQDHLLTLSGTDKFIRNPDPLLSILWPEAHSLTMSYEYDGYEVEYIFLIDMASPSLVEGWLSNIRISSIQENKEIFCINVKQEKLYVERYDVTSLRDEFLGFCAQRCYSFLDKILDVGQEILEDIKNTSASLYTGYGEFSAKQVVEMMEQRDQLVAFLPYSTRPAQKAIFSKCISHQDHETLKYERIKSQLQRNTLLYLPIFDILKGVSKDSTRKVLMDLLQEKALLSNRQELKQTSDNLWMVMTDFEVSDYDTLLDYFVAKENEGGFASATDSKHYPIEDFFDVCKCFMQGADCCHNESGSFGFLYSTLLSYCDIICDSSLYYCDYSTYHDDIDSLCQLFEKYVRMTMEHVIFAEQIVKQ